MFKAELLAWLVCFCASSVVGRYIFYIMVSVIVEASCYNGLRMIGLSSMGGLHPCFHIHIGKGLSKAQRATELPPLNTLEPPLFLLILISEARAMNSESQPFVPAVCFH